MIAHLKLILLLFIFASGAVQAKVLQCGSLFYSDPFVKQKMDAEMARAAAESVKNLKNSTTGARIENKWTLQQSQVKHLIEKLRHDLKAFNISIQARDAVTQDQKNVTQTVYLEQFKLNVKDSGLTIGPDFDLAEVTFKPRIRKYGTIDANQSVSLENIKFAEFTKDFSFVEFKFPDARFKGAVFKPRMYMSDKYIEMLGTEKFLQNYDEIELQTLALKLNQADVESAHAMLHFIKLGHLKKVSFAKVAVNLYERISLAINFVDQKLQNSVFQIQMTLDQSISLFVYELGRTIEAYEKDHTVIEVKTPVEQAKYTLTSDLSAIPGYKSLLEFLNVVQKSHLPEYMEGVGKNGHGHRGYLLETNKTSAFEKNDL